MKNSKLMILTIVLGILVCALGGYVAYDKLVASTTKNDTNDSSEQTNNDMDTSSFYKSVFLDYAINSKIVKVGFHYNLEKKEEFQGTLSNALYVTLSFDGKLSTNKYLVEQFEKDDEYKSSNIYDEIGRNSLTVMNGADKEYFVFHNRVIYSDTVVVMADSGTLIYKVPFDAGGVFYIDERNYNGYNNFYLTNNAIYYIDNTCGNYKLKSDGSTFEVNEYKVTINNNKATATKNKTYETTQVAGQIC